MSIKTVPPSYSQDLAPCDFWLFPKLRSSRYETIEKMKEAVTKVIDTLTPEDFHGAFKKLLEQYNKCVVAGGGYFEGYSSFMCVLSIKVTIRKNSLETYLMILVYICEWGRGCVCMCVFMCVCVLQIKKKMIEGKSVQQIHKFYIFAYHKKSTAKQK